MDDLNPYQPPEPLVKSADDQSDLAVAQQGDCWCDGQYLVTTLRAQLPPRCVITNVVEGQEIAHTCYWFPLWAMLGFLLGPFGIVILVAGCRAVRVRMSLCDYLLQKRARHIRNSLLFAALAIPVGVVVSIGWPDWYPWAFVMTVAATYVGVQNAFIHRNVLTIHRVTRTHVWLTGAGEAFLSTLPPWVNARSV